MMSQGYRTFSGPLYSYGTTVMCVVHGHWKVIMWRMTVLWKLLEFAYCPSSPETSEDVSRCVSSFSSCLALGSLSLYWLSF